MQETPSLETPENWDLASQGYAERVAPFLIESYAAELVDRLGVNENTEVLEIAAGSGALTATLCKRVKSVLATDFSPKMIDILRERMRLAGATNVTCEVMDGQALALPDESYDRVAACFGLMLFPDRAKGFSEMRRVLRPGGRAMVSAWAGPEKFEALGLFLGAVTKAFPDMPPPPAPPPVFSLADPRRFKLEMEAAGFQKVQVDFLTRELETKGFEDMWAMLTVGAPPVRALFDRVGEEGMARLRATLAEIVKSRFGNGPIRTTNVATVGCGTR